MTSPKSPKPTNPAYGRVDGTSLVGISCPAENLCFAVGRVTMSNAFAGLIEEWNGSTWSLSPADPASAGQYWAFGGVECTQVDACFAVGFTSVGTDEPTTTVVQQWNGIQWTQVASPNFDEDQDSLNTVACAASDVCFALGDASTAPQLIEQWDGKEWTITGVPSETFASFSASCVDVTLCFAVGLRGIEQWDGTNWSVLSSSPKLSGVACVPSDEFCIAVGYHKHFV